MQQCKKCAQKWIESVLNNENTLCPACERAAKHNLCRSCLSKLIYSEKFDCYFCMQCNIWTELNCLDSKCFYCKDRPEKPIEKKDAKTKES